MMPALVGDDKATRFLPIEVTLSSLSLWKFQLKPSRPCQRSPRPRTGPIKGFVVEWEVDDKTKGSAIVRFMSSTTVRHSSCETRPSKLDFSVDTPLL